MKSVFLLLLLGVAMTLDAAKPRFKGQADPVVAASAPHPYGYDWLMGETTDPYLSGDLVLLRWDYHADESPFLPHPGYQIYRKVNDEPFQRVAWMIDQKEYVDDLSGTPNGSTVSYFILTRQFGQAQHLSPVLTFLYLESWPP